MRRLRAVDRALLLVLVPLWAVLFGLHVSNAARGRLAEPNVYIEAPEHADAFPRVRSLRVAVAAEISGLEAGDRLLRIGDSDLRGVGPLGFFARAQREMGADRSATVAFAREGERGEVRLEYTPLPLPIRFILVSLSFALSGILLILRAPRSPSAISMSRALLLFGFAFTRSWGGPETQTYLWMGVAGGLGVFIPPALIYAARAFPDDVEPWSRPARVWPWAFALIAPTFLSALVGFPLFGDQGNLADPISMLMLIALGVTLLVILTRNYRRCDPVGRRKIKWVVYGLYVALVPVLVATAISVSDPVRWWLSDASEIFFVLIPLFIFIAIARFSLFDIDRLISATASYTILIGAVVVGVLTVIPRLALATSEAFGIDPASGQTLLSLTLASLALPVQRYLRPRVDRWFFPDRHLLEEQIQQLLRELSDLETPGRLAAHAAGRLEELLRPDGCVVYVRTSDRYANVFARGRVVPPLFEPDHPVIAALRRHDTPVAAAAWSRPSRGAELSPFDRAVLETLDAAVLVPIRHRDALLAFVCLGPKRSGDIYTPTDLVLLSAVGEKVANELLRFDDAEIIRQSRAMEDALRRYVPGAIADELAAGQDLKSGEREVSVLFVDIREYTSYAEGRRAEEIFSTVNRYTQIVSSTVLKHGGSVVEFNGDGMMVVFGAPHELAFKERAALEAGCEIARAVEALPLDGAPAEPQHLSVGIGIATGEAFVGNIRAADRMIWSAIGNTTNLAARLQTLTRELDAAVVIDAATWNAIGYEPPGFERREKIPIRGRSERMDVFALPLANPSPAIARSSAANGSGTGRTG